MLLATVRPRCDPDARFLQAPERVRNIGIPFELAKTLQHLVATIHIPAQLLEHRTKARGCELAERPELARERKRRGRVQHPPNHASEAPSGAPAVVRRTRNGERSNLVPITLKTTASVTVHLR